MFVHIHYVRLALISENAPRFGRTLHYQDWLKERQPVAIEKMLHQSASDVGQTILSCIRDPQPIKFHYDHPVLFLQHMVWHEGYHHGQIKLALKVCGHSLMDKEVGPDTWGLWMRKAKLVNSK